MKPVHQTVFGSRGNCMSACLASLFEIPLEDVPNFYDAGPDDSDWYNALRDWLRGKGWGFVSISFGEGLSVNRMEGWQMVWGKSPRGDHLHQTVWHRGKMVHDPHPDGTGLLTIEGADLLYPLDVAAFAAPPLEQGQSGPGELVWQAWQVFGERVQAAHAVPAQATQPALTEPESAAQRAYLKERIAYWDENLTEHYKQAGAETFISCVVSLLANRDAFNWKPPATQPDADLTAAYMAGFERGKDAAKAAQRLAHDAARYRWLQECQWHQEPNGYTGERSWLWSVRFAASMAASGDLDHVTQQQELDAAIDERIAQDAHDAAMAQTSEPKT